LILKGIGYFARVEAYVNSVILFTFMDGPIIRAITGTIRLPATPQRILLTGNLRAAFLSEI